MSDKKRLTLDCINILIDRLSLEDTKVLEQSVYDKLYQVSYWPTYNRYKYDHKDIIVKANDEHEAIIKAIKVFSDDEDILITTSYIKNKNIIERNECRICNQDVKFDNIKEHLSNHTFDEKYNILYEDFYSSKIKVFE